MDYGFESLKNVQLLLQSQLQLRLLSQKPRERALGVLCAQVRESISFLLWARQTSVSYQCHPVVSMSLSRSSFGERQRPPRNPCPSNALQHRNHTKITPSYPVFRARHFLQFRNTLSKPFFALLILLLRVPEIRTDKFRISLCSVSKHKVNHNTPIVHHYLLSSTTASAIFEKEYKFRWVQRADNVNISISKHYEN